MDAEDGFWWWLAGMADGESCFVMQRFPGGRVLKGGGRSYSWRFAWVIALRDDDREVLETIQRRVGGSLHSHQKKSGTNPQTILSVNRREDLHRLVQRFREYPLQSKKAVDFVIWSSALEEWDAAPRVNRGVGGGKGGGRKPQDVHDRMAYYFSELSKRRLMYRGEV